MRKTPILTFAEDGQLVNVAKVRGRKQVQGKLIELVKEQVGDHKAFNLLVANGGAEEEMKQLLRLAIRYVPKASYTPAFPPATLTRHTPHVLRQ